MSTITIEEAGLGRITIEPERDTSKHQKLAMKSLAILQLMCMERDEDEQQFRSFLKIVRDATIESKKLYREEEENEFSPISAF